MKKAGDPTKSFGVYSELQSHSGAPRFDCKPHNSTVRHTSSTRDRHWKKVTRVQRLIGRVSTCKVRGKSGRGKAESRGAEMTVESDEVSGQVKISSARGDALTVVGRAARTLSG